MHHNRIIWLEFSFIGGNVSDEMFAFEIDVR